MCKYLLIFRKEMYRSITQELFAKGAVDKVLN
jgi:sRNA-binding carbon storage regulator CsrA